MRRLFSRGTTDEFYGPQNIFYIEGEENGCPCYTETNLKYKKTVVVFDKCKNKMRARGSSV